VRYLLYWYKSANADATHLWQGEDGEEDEIALIRQCAGAGAHFTCFTGTKNVQMLTLQILTLRSAFEQAHARGAGPGILTLLALLVQNVRVLTAAALGQEDYMNMIILALRALTSLRR
jgi:hypothetical protein